VETTVAVQVFPRIRYIWISAYAFAHSALWNSVHPIVLPALLLPLVPADQKNSYLGLLTFLGLVLAMVAQPVFGAASDGSRHAWGRRRPYMFAGVIFTVPLLATVGVVESFAMLVAVYLALQVASNAIQGSYQAFIPDLVPPERRGLASGAKNLAEILGVILATLLIGQMMDSYIKTGDRVWVWTVLALLGGTLVLGLTMTMFGVPEVRRLKALPGTLVERLLSGLRSYRREQKQFAWFLLSRFLFILPITAIQSFAFFYMQDGIGMENPASATAQLVAIIAVAILVLVYPAGLLSDRVGRKPIMIVAGLFGAVGAILLMFAASFVQVLAFGSLIGVSVGLYLSSSWAFAADISSGEEPGKYLGLTNLATAGGAAMARVNGPVIDLFNGMNRGTGYVALFAICALSFLAGTWTVTRLRAAR